MGGARKLSLALVAAICAVVLAACGGGDDDTSSSTAADSTSAESTVAGGATGQQGGDDKGGKGNGSDDNGGGGSGDDKGSGSGPGSGGSDDSGGGDSGKGGSSGLSGVSFSGPPKKHEHPAPVDGERADGFRVPGGDNSIQEYGEEEGSEERTAAMLPIAALYRAFDSSDWNEVCSTYLSSGNVEQITLLAEKSPQLKGKGCAQILNGLNQAAPPGPTPDTPDGGIVSFRTEGDTGFAIYWGIDGKGYAFALKTENGAWKLTSLAPTPLQVG